MVALATLVTSCLAFAPTPRTPSRCNSRDARAYVVAFAAPPRQPPLSFTPPRAQRCEIFAFNEGLDDEKIAALFNEFDTDASGFIELDELEAALKKAGRPVSRQAAQNILERVDLNSDGLISVDEFKAVFKLAPGAIPDELKPLTGVSGFFLNGLGLVGDALGIDTRAGQWRTTRYGSRYVDDLIGEGDVILPGDVVLIHYTVTVLETGTVVETTRGGSPLGFQLGEATGADQGWNDACEGMRVGGQRRVYAKDDADGDAAANARSSVRYDLEVVAVEGTADRDAREKAIASMGGRRAAARLLFAATFVPYFIPDEYKPELFRSGKPPSTAPMDAAFDSAPAVDKSDAYVSQQMDALFSQEGLPKSKKK